MKCKMLIAAALLSVSVSGQALAGAVIVAADSPAATMSADEVKRLFMGREASLAGQTVTVVYQRSGSAKTEFESEVLGTSGAQLSSYWSKLIFTGKAKAPDEVEGDAAVKAKVTSTPGAVGYVDDAVVDGSVKVLFTF